MEKIYVCCGLGDCLLYCQIYDLYRDTFKYKYVLSKKFVTLYKNNPDVYCDFVLNIFNMFNVPLKITKNNHDQIEPKKLLLEYPLKTNSLSKYIPIINIELPDEYIVINLNIRTVKEYTDNNSIIFMINHLVYMLNTYDFKIPLVIIGHRSTFEKYNVINYSFYDKLILTKFIDKSYNDDLLNKPNINNLIYDINILKNAKETFQFGFGGSLCLNVMFSNKLSCIFNPENEIIYQYFSTEYFDLNKNIKFYKTRDELLERLQNYSNNNIKNINSYDNLVNILKKNDYQYIINNDKDSSIQYIAVGIGDILFKLVNLQENLVNKPVYINLDLFQSGYIKINKTSEALVWFDNPYNNFIFRINLLNDIIENSIYFEKKDFIFVITNNDALDIAIINSTFNFKKIQKYNLLMNNNFYTNNDFKKYAQYFRNIIQQFVKDPFIIFHTKLRLNKNYDYKQIKEHLNLFFSGFKIKNFNIILLGEQNFKSNLESTLHGITTIYPELLKLYNYNSNKILDLTKEYIYNELNYDEYKNDICLMHQAKYNICYGQGGQLCSSLLFGKCIFFDPIDEEYFFQNMNLYNSGHRYFKKLDMINKYLLEIL
jgi:hypothetical protein